MTRIEWRGDDQIKRNLALYGQRVQQVIKQVADYWAAVFEAYARSHAPWTDRSGNARQSLWADVEELANDTVALYLSHGVEYGRYLETRWAGRYAIIWPTIETHLGQIQRMLQEIFD